MPETGSGLDVDSIKPEELMAFQRGGGVVVGGNGEEFFAFTPNSSQYTKPLIDGKKVLYTLQNEFVSLGMERQKNLLFTEKPKYHVYDKNDDEIEEMGRSVEKDFERKEMPAGLFAAMKLCYTDIYGWGCYLLQVGWIRDVDNVIRPSKFKRLPPESFIQLPKDTSNYLADDILQGIGVRNGIIEFNQTQANGTIKKLNNVIMMKDPSLPGICGRSRLLPAIPIVSFLDLCMKSQAQKINRIGAPALFIQFTSAPIVISGRRDDITHAKLIIQNWGKESQYILRENMQIVKLDFSDNQSAIETIKELKKDLDDHFNPSSFLQKQTTSTGGSDSGKIDTMKLFIQDAHMMIEDNWEPLVASYLEMNGYEYTVELEIPAAEPDRAALNLLRAEAADRMGIATMNEKRILAGFAEATPEIIAEIEADNRKKAALIPGVKPATTNDGIQNKQNPNNQNAPPRNPANNAEE